jgi:cysteine-S-conjugate beta-lyase
MDDAEFDDVSLERLRRRSSSKWTRFDADVLPAWIAEMDFALAPSIHERLKEAIDLGDTGYASEGLLAPSFVEFARRFEWTVEEEQVILVPDIMVGVAELLKAFTGAGDGVVINPPVYPPFYTTIESVGRRAVPVPLRLTGGGWELDLDGLAQAFARGARAYLLCNPHNPTGRVFDEHELRTVAALAARHDVAVISDEVHAPLTMPAFRHVPFVSITLASKGRNFTLMSASKGWNVPALKCAVVVPARPLVGTALQRLPVDLIDRVSHLGVIAAAAAFSPDGVAWLNRLVSYLDENRRLLRDLLATNLPKIRFTPPEAGYLAWLDCRALELGNNPADTFLARGRVALYAGARFGPEGDGHVPFNFGTSRLLVEDAVVRMRMAVGEAARREVSTSQD